MDYDRIKLEYNESVLHNMGGEEETFMWKCHIYLGLIFGFFLKELFLLWI